ncbi:MAG TPA: hypothetical protein VFN49_06030, partial [Candidatus Aquilonibacter sp.]|nr:hypothetical protein [Candidatus Aquilonibacter sp.]
RKAPFRAFGFAYILLVIEMIVSHGKHYYMGAVYPILIAAGGVAIESWTRDRNLTRIAVTAYALVLGPVFIPFSLPVLSEPAFIAYEHGLQAALHIPKGITATEHGRESSELPGDWADMHGWRELAENVKQHYDALPPAERKQAVVFASNYGEASAIAFFTPDVPVISGHNQYWLWGSRGFSGNVVIDVNGDCGADRHLFRSATRIGTFGTTYSIGYERDRPIMLCQGLTQPWASVWAGVREYI